MLSARRTRGESAEKPTPQLRLSEMDIRRLVKGDSVDERAAAAHKLCRAVERASLTEEDREAAQGIIRVLASDTAELVRRALAVTLKTSDLLPRDVAMRLARRLGVWWRCRSSTPRPCSPTRTLVEIVRVETSSAGKSPWPNVSVCPSR